MYRAKMSSVKERKKRVKYSRETLREAMAAVKAGMPILKASAKYQIPRTTLRNKQKAKDIDKKPGPGTVLTAEEEETLVQWIIDCSNIGMPVAKQQLQNSVLMLMKKLNRFHPFTNGRPSNHWYRNFLSRNEKIVNRVLDNIAIAKAAATESGVRNWFENVERYLQEKKLLGIDPSRVFSSETVFIANPNKNESNDNLCIQMTGNAAGQLTCPMIVFTEETITDDICKMMPPGWTIGKSESGSMTAENFYGYITDCLYPWLVKNNIEFPIVLFLHGRVSHVTLSLTEFCSERSIELVALHPNSVHLLHPLEILFSSFKTAWQQVMDVYCKGDSTAVLAKENIAPFVKSTLETLNVANLLKNGFISCGLHPLSVDIIDFKKIPDRIADKPLKRVEFAPYVATVTPKPIEQKPSLSVEVFLRMFEERLDPNILQEFKNAEKSDIWQGDEKATALFYYWKNALNEASNSTAIDCDSTNNSCLNTENNNADLSDIEFDDVNSFLEIESQSEDPTAPANPIKIFLKTADR